MAEAGYKSLISYRLANIAFVIGWEFVPVYYNKYEDRRQRDQIKQALRSHKQNIVEGSSDRSLSSKLTLYDVAKSSGMEALEDFEDILKLEKLTRGYMLDKQMNAVEKKHETEGGYKENLLKKRLRYKNFQRGFLKLSKNALAMYLIISTVLVGTGLIYLFSPSWFGNETQAAWFNDEWAYRKPITFTHNASASNTYIQLDIDTQDAPDKIQADCGDIRFTDVSGKLLNYYYDSVAGACDTASTDFDVLIPTIVNGGNLIYMYYGNPGAVDGTNSSSLSSQGFSETTPSGGAGSAGTEAAGPAPTLYWKFDDLAVGTAEDQTANGLDGTHNNTPAIKTEDFCVAGKCLYFDGANNENVSKSDDAKLDFAAADNFTVSAWVKRNGASSAVNYILTKAAGATYTGYKLSMDASGDLCFTVRDGTNAEDSACTSAVDFDDDQWHLVTGVKAGTTSITLYVDGNQRAQDASIASTGTLANAGTFYVGVDTDGTSNEWLGFIDEVKVYRDNSARSAAQVKADYNSRSDNEGVSSNLGANTQNQPGALSSGLVGYWNMDESSGNMSDSSGNSTTLTDTNTVAFAVGKYANGADFELGNSEYQYAADNASLSITASLTLAAWIKPETVSAGSYNILGKWDGANESYRLFQNGDEIRLELDSAGNYVETSAYNLAAGTWYHVVGVYDSNLSTARIYINGTEATTSTTGTIPSSIGDDGGRFQIGAEDSTGSATGYYDGIIDDARIYNRALSSGEVFQLYNFAPGPTGYWKLDENSSPSLDSSGNGYSGTWSGNTSYTTGKFGKASSFDGSGDYITASSGQINSLHGTAMAWVYPTETGGSYDIVGSGIAGHDFRISPAQNLYGFYISATDYRVSYATDPTANTWTHVAVTWDQTNGSVLYINGLRVATNSTPPPAFTQTGIQIGGFSGDDLQGSVDEVKTYNYPRTPKQIIEDMNAGHPAPGSPVGSAVAHWKFDEGYSTTANDSNASNGGSENLTLSTASWTQAGKFGKAWNGTGAIWLSRANDADLDFAAAEDFTLSGWFKSDSATNPANGTEYLLSTTTGNTDVGYSIYATTGGLICFGIDDDTTWGPNVASCTTTDFYDGTWHYFTAVRDTTADTTRLYIDAISRDSDTDTTTGTLDGDNVFYVGDFDGDNNATAGTEEFAGDIDELKVYRSALTESQVALDMNQGKGQVMGTLSDKTGTGYESQDNANQEYCIPGDTSTCTAPTGRWDFEEGTGATVYDTSASSSNRDGTWNGSGSRYVNGKTGKGAIFNGSDDYVQVNDSRTMSDFIANSNATIEAWIKPAAAGPSSTNSYNSDPIIEGDAQYIGITHGTISGSDRIWVYNWDSNEDRVGITYTVGEWVHIALVHTGGTLYGYKNGQLVSSTTSGNTGSVAGSLKFGDITPSTNHFFNGQIDQVRTFNYGRSAAQIAWDYNKGKPVAHYKMDECQGTTINNSVVSSNGGNPGLSGTYSGTTSAGTCGTSGAWFNGVTGKRNYSLDFAGSDEVVTVTNADAIDFDVGLKSAVTFSGWIYAGSAGESSVGQIYNKGTNTWLRVDTPSGSSLDIEASLDLATTDATVNISAPITTGTWNHVAVTYTDDSDDEITVYINGISRGTSTNGVGAPAGTDTNNLLIGGPTTANFDGQIDDFRVYSYELTAKQVQMIMNDGATQYGPDTGAP